MNSLVFGVLTSNSSVRSDPSGSTFNVIIGSLFAFTIVAMQNNNKNSNFLSIIIIN